MAREWMTIDGVDKCVLFLLQMTDRVLHLSGCQAIFNVPSHIVS
jgi:hypothetical protein